MYPAPFDYHRPVAIAEVLDLLRTLEGDVKLLAGGHSLIPAMKLRLIQPSHVVDLSGISELRGFRLADGILTIGSMTTHWEVESSAIVRSNAPLLAEAAGLIGDPQVRNRGTIGGSLCHSDPAADYAANVLALDAEMVCVGQQGKRRIKASDWFQGLMTTALREDEILLEVLVPILAHLTGAAYIKFPHQASRFTVAGAAAFVTLSEDGTCRTNSTGHHRGRRKRFPRHDHRKTLGRNAFDAGRSRKGLSSRMRRTRTGGRSDASCGRPSSTVPSRSAACGS